ncbi:MAG: carbamoyltransferase C-terminal domain-containing protein, partial [Candidatus Competibacterales bacterium]|nr:carbamoyltransferase C-terminal domain-containing protein [Candidatus Competibacterales bacterium]
KDDGTFRLDMAYFDYCTGLAMTNGRFHELFGGPPRQPETPITRREMDLAASIQVVTEEVVLRLARSLHRETGEPYLCLAGGVALNCVANGRLLRQGPFRDIWVQPAAGDAGGALGATLAAHFGNHEAHASSRAMDTDRDAMQGGYLGPCFDGGAIRSELDALGARYTALGDDELADQVAGLLADGQVIGWFQGRMEFGPRALGARSILADPRAPSMQTQLNLKIKFRESFRPFAPAVLAEKASEYFDLDRSSPYMLLVAQVNKSLHRSPGPGEQALAGLERLRATRSILPAITHVDHSARIQTVHADTNPRFHRLLQAFEQRTGCAVLVNTSFNVRGEPIVCTPGDAYRCFMGTDMDYLVLDNLLLSKREQPSTPSTAFRRGALALD